MSCMLLSLAVVPFHTLPSSEAASQYEASPSKKTYSCDYDLTPVDTLAYQLVALCVARFGMKGDPTGKLIADRRRIL